MIERAKQLESTGLEPERAHGVAWFEERITLWPPDWGNRLQFLLYGDFKPPEQELVISSLGITVGAEKRADTVVSGAMCVLDASVSVHERTAVGLVEAVRRINLFLGAEALVSWGNAHAGWWSWITHASGGGVLGTLGDGHAEEVVGQVVGLSPEVRRRVEAALFWIRDSQGLLLQSYRSDTLRTYAALWNAFECLVEAVNLLRPRPKLSKSAKQEAIGRYLAVLGDMPLNAGHVQELYKRVVDPGFVGRATHALRVCFGEDADCYISECFLLPDQAQRLYNVRNSINHGSVDAENPQELVRVAARQSRLWMIVWGMFGRIVRFPTPVDPDLGNSTEMAHDD